MPDKDEYAQIIDRQAQFFWEMMKLRMCIVAGNLS
jgi:hypothetical protein